LGTKNLPFYDIDKLPLEDYTEAPSYEIAGISDTKPGEKIVWYEWHWNRKITTAVAGAFLFSLVKQFSRGDALWSGTTE